MSSRPNVRFARLSQRPFMAQSGLLKISVLMPKTYGSVTDRILCRAPGGSFVVSTQKRIDYSAARKHTPDRDWAAEPREAAGW
jgi:hypothetical protein